MRRSRPDSTTREAVDNLRRMGVMVAYTQGLSPGFPDTLAAWRGVNHLIEFKVLGQRLRESQVKFARVWTGCIHVATSSAQAMELIRECDGRVRREIATGGPPDFCVGCGGGGGSEAAK